VALALDAPPAADGALMLGLALGTLILGFLGAVGAALTLGARRGSVLLSLLVLPLAMPVLIFGARATDQAMRGEPTGGGLWLLAALAILVVVLLPWAIAQAVRVSLE